MSVPSAISAAMASASFRYSDFDIIAPSSMFRLHRDMYRINMSASTRLYRDMRRLPRSRACGPLDERLRRRPRIASEQPLETRHALQLFQSSSGPLVTKAIKAHCPGCSAPAGTGSRDISSVAPPSSASASSTTAPCATSASSGPRSKRRSTVSSHFPSQGRRCPHGADGRHHSGRLCRRLPDLLHEGRIRRRLLHRRHSACCRS